MKQRILILGTCGSGKTTLGNKLSKQLGIPHFELDSFHWEPNWQETDLATFRKRVEEAISHEGWIIDGNYSKARDLIWPKAEIAIWLDYSFGVILFRLLQRIFRRHKTKEELWPGCQETLTKQFLTRSSILLWAMKSFGKRRRSYPGVLKENDHLRVIHVRSPRKLDAALKRLFDHHE